MFISIAEKKDYKDINSILDELNLGYSIQDNYDFYVAKEKDKIIAVVQCLEFDNFYFIANLGVLPSHRKQKLGKLLIEKTTRNFLKDTYLYTIIPEYFEKIGFIKTKLKDFLPKKSMFDCSTCVPEKCTCMVRYAK